MEQDRWTCAHIALGSRVWTPHDDVAGHDAQTATKMAASLISLCILLCSRFLLPLALILVSHILSLYTLLLVLEFNQASA